MRMFRISALADYALVLMTHLDTTRVQSIKSLTVSTKLPYATLAKLASKLEKHKLLKSKEGRGGGYLLAKPPHEITLRAIIEALEGPIAPVKCITHPGACQFEKGCEVKPRWKNLTNDLIQWADSYTLRDLVRKQ